MWRAMQYKIYNFIDARSANYSFDEGTFYFPSMSLSLSLSKLVAHAEEVGYRIKFVITKRNVPALPKA
jgi:hypothetical protein